MLNLSVARQPLLNWPVKTGTPRRHACRFVLDIYGMKQTCYRVHLWRYLGSMFLFLLRDHFSFSMIMLRISKEQAK